jgi:hypothetical protein
LLSSYLFFLFDLAFPQHHIPTPVHLIASLQKKKNGSKAASNVFFFFLKVPRNRVAEKSREQKKARKEKQEGEGDDLKGGYIKKRSDN